MVDTREVFQIMKNEENHYEYLPFKDFAAPPVCTRKSQEDRAENSH